MRKRNDLGNKEIFSDNLKRYIEDTDVSRMELSKSLDIPYSTLSLSLIHI